VIDSGTGSERKNTYYSIMNNDGRTILRVDSLIGGFTGLSRIQKSPLFTITPSMYYDVNKKFKGEIGFFDLSKPEIIYYNRVGDQSFDHSWIDGKKVITLSQGNYDQKTGPVIKAWSINLGCTPTEYRF
jgi:hypothetical protein